jgi:two-component system response regulator NreC
MPVDNLLILHIEDDPLWRGLFGRLVQSISDVRQCVQCETGAKGLDLALTHQPDIVFLDLRLPDADGFTLAEELARLVATSRILLLSARNDDSALINATQPHIAGLIWKSSEIAQQLPVAIETVSAGRKYFSRVVREQLRRLRADPQAFHKILSDREIGLLPRFGLGLTDQEIAAQSGLSPLTVKSHRQHIMAKLGLHRTPELIHWAIQHGFVPPPPRIGWVCEDAD